MIAEIFTCQGFDRLNTIDIFDNGRRQNGIGFHRIAIHFFKWFHESENHDDIDRQREQTDKEQVKVLREQNNRHDDNDRHIQEDGQNSTSQGINDTIGIVEARYDFPCPSRSEKRHG